MPVPLFLSDYEEEPHPAAFRIRLRERRIGKKRARASRIVAGVVAVSAMAAVLALFSIDLDARRHRQRQGLAGRRGARSVRRRAASRAQVRRSCRRVPHRSAEPAAAATGPSGRRKLAADGHAANALASASPSRDEITAAYQSALKGKVAVPEPVAREAAREAAGAGSPRVRAGRPRSRPARRIDAG